MRPTSDPVVSTCDQRAVLERVLDLDAVEINAKAGPSLGLNLVGGAGTAGKKLRVQGIQ